MILKTGALAEKRGKILWNCRENGVLGVSQAKQTQRSKNKTNTTQTSNKKKRTNKKKNNKSNKKNRQQTQDKNTDCCSKHPPQKSSRGESGRGLFSLVFVGNGALAILEKPQKAKTAPKN